MWDGQRHLVAHLRRLAEDFSDPRADCMGRSHCVELIADFAVSFASLESGARATPLDILSAPHLYVDLAIFAKIVANFDQLPYLGVFHAACCEDPASRYSVSSPSSASCCS